MLSLRTRWLVFLVTVALGVLWVSPNFVKLEKEHWLAKSKMTLGLDIQGGLHLVMGVDVTGHHKVRSRELPEESADVINQRLSAGDVRGRVGVGAILGPCLVKQFLPQRLVGLAPCTGVEHDQVVHFHGCPLLCLRQKPLRGDDIRIGLSATVAAMTSNIRGSDQQCAS